MKTRLIHLLLIAVLLASVSSCAKSDAPLTAADYLSLGEKFLLELDYEQAVVQFLKVIEIEPMNPRGYTGAAEAYIALGDIGEAADVLREGLEALPDNEEIQDLADELETESEGEDAGGESAEAPAAPSEEPSTESTPQQPDGASSPVPSDDNSLGTFTVAGTVGGVYSVDSFGDTYQVYIEEYGAENVGNMTGISFAEPLTLPSGETISYAVVGQGDDISGDEFSAPQISGRPHIFTGTLEYNEYYSELMPPGTWANDNYIYNPWGPYRFVVDAVETPAESRTITELGTYTVEGMIVRAESPNEEKYQAYREEYGTENVSAYIGISFRACLQSFQNQSDKG